MSQREHVSVVFSTIMPQNLEAFRHAQQILTPAHFEDKHTQALWSILLKFAQRYSGVASKAFLKGKFKEVSTQSTRSDLIILENMVDQFTDNSPFSLPTFKASVDALHDNYIKTKTAKALVEAFEIVEHGAEVDGEEVIGHQAARDRAFTVLRAIEAEATIGEISEGAATEDSDFLDSYQEVKQRRLDESGGGVGTGIRTLDEHLGGMMPGDLVLLGAFTSQGKTQMLCQMAWHAAVKQKMNVFFSTTETVRRQVHCRIIARHSRLPQFKCPGGLNSKHILKGTLSPEHEKVMEAVVLDLRTGDYGSIFISQNPSDASWDHVESRIDSWKQQTGKNIELVLIDSVYLLRPNRKRNSTREELTDLLQDSKRRATAMEVPIVSPWQMSRAALDKALDGHGYSISSFADTSEAEKSASILVTLLRYDSLGSDIHVQVLKNRDGEVLDDLVLEIDFRNAYFSDHTDSDSVPVGQGVVFNGLGAF